MRILMLAILLPALAACSMSLEYGHEYEQPKTVFRIRPEPTPSDVSETAKYTMIARNCDVGTRKERSGALTFYLSHPGRNIEWAKLYFKRPGDAKDIIADMEWVTPEWIFTVPAGHLTPGHWSYKIVARVEGTDILVPEETRRAVTITPLTGAD